MKVGSVLVVLGTVTVLCSSSISATEPVVASAVVTPEVVTNALTKDAKITAAKPAMPSQPPQVSSKPPFEDMKWYNRRAFQIDHRMDQAGFDEFCKMHPDVDHIEIIDSQKITSLEGVSKLTRLQSLILYCLGPSEQKEFRLDLTPLAGLTEMTELECHSIRVSNTGALKGLKKLKKLSFARCDMESIDFIKEFPALEKLDLYGYDHSFPNYEPLAGSKLKMLNVYKNKQATDENLKVLGTIQSLEEFYAAVTPSFSSIEFLRNQPNLRVVDLWNDPISDISPLAGKKKLEKLYLRGTKVTDLSALSDAESLYRLNLEDTSIKDITPLLGLKKLRTLQLPSTVPADQIEKLKAVNPSLTIEVEAPRK